MNDQQIERALDELENVATHVTGLADELEPERRTGLCIGTSRMAMLALRHMGLRADASAVKLAAYTPAYMQMLDETGDRELTAEHVGEWRMRGAWAVVIGPRTRGLELHHTGDRPGFHGHVIVSVQRRWIIDLTLGQASRPSHGLKLPPTMWADCAPLARRESGVAFDIDGVTLTYEPIKDRSYLGAHDWVAQRPTDVAVRNLAKRLRDVARGRPVKGLRRPSIALHDGKMPVGSRVL